MVHGIYVSGLPPGFKPVEVANVLCVGMESDQVPEGITHNPTVFFFICKDEQTSEYLVHKFHGKPVYERVGQVSSLTDELRNILVRLKPELLGATGGTTGGAMPKSGNQPPPQRVSLPVSDIIDAVAGWTLEDKQKLGIALGFNQLGVGNPVPATANGSGQYGKSAPLAPHSKPQHPVYTTPQQQQVMQQYPYQTLGHPTPPQPVFTSSPQPRQSFQFGSSNTINNIRVTTFSGTSKDCSYEQFRHDVHYLLKQGCPDVMVLNAIKRSIKGQAQEIVLHMGEDATVADILSRYEIMFGDVNPPHVLLAQFYAASQSPGESMTDWYSRLEDLATRITRKDNNVISPNNYDILVNTQFWTKLHNGQMRNALRHKFDALVNSPQLIVEARKVESEFSTPEVQANQLNSDVSSTIQQGFEQLNSRLTALERRVGLQSTTPVERSLPNPRQGKTANRGPRKQLTCFKCHKLGHIARECTLNSQGSGQGSGPTTH